jgi:tRNA(fMet)-specific endonuclease VapC
MQPEGRPGCAHSMIRSLLDTDILSEIIKGRDPGVVAKARVYLEQLGRFTTSAGSVAEIIHGFRRIGREDRVSQFEASLTHAEVLSFDAAAARHAGRINADLERSGRTIGMPDVMIAGIALHHQLPLVTGNTAHFAYVRDAGYDLTCENWREA